MAFAGPRADMAFAASFFIKNIFSTIGFAISNYICTYAKIMIGVVMGLVGVGFYIALEILLHKGYWGAAHTDKPVPETKNVDYYIAKYRQFGNDEIDGQKKDINGDIGVVNEAYSVGATAF